MSSPTSIFPKIEYQKPITPRIFLQILSAIVVGAVAVVLMFWQRGKSTQILPFWAMLIGALLTACALTFSPKLYEWEEKIDVGESEKELEQLRGIWQEWTRRLLAIIDVAAFPAGSNEVARFGNAKIDLPTSSGRGFIFYRVSVRAIRCRRSRLLHLISKRFAETLQVWKEVISHTDAV